MSKHIFNWRRQLPDQRDYQFAAPITGNPSSVDLEPQMPPVYDQGQRGSCTANGTLGAFEYALLEQKLLDVPLSRRFLYICSLIAEGSFPNDAGAVIRDVIKIAAKTGICAEKLFPYGASKFFTKPPKKCYTDALNNLVVQYAAVTQDANHLKGCIAAKRPVIFGITVYESFESDAAAKTGIIPMPSKKEKDLGGHCIDGVAYDDATQLYKFRNSWGPSWGANGYGFLPFEYVESAKFASDFWTVEVVK